MKFYIIRNIGFLSVLFWTTSFFGQDKIWTLEECVAYAIENNIDIRQTVIEEERAEINKQTSIGNFLPSVNGNANHSWTLGLNQNITTGILENQTTQFTSAGIDVQIDVFKGLQNQNQLSKARLLSLAARYESQKMKEDVSLNVINAYLQIVFNKELLKTCRAQLLDKENQQKRTEDLIDAGMVPAGDLLDIKATVAQTLQQLIAAENNLEISKLVLAQMLQLKNYKQFDVADMEVEAVLSDVLSIPAAKVIESAKSAHVDLKLAEARVLIADKDLQISKGLLLPQIKAFYSFATRAAYMDRITDFRLDPTNPTKVIGFVEGTNQNVMQPNMQPIISGPESLWNQFDANKGQSFGIGIVIPIFNGLSSRNNIKMNRLNLQKIKNESEMSELKLEQTVYTVYSDAQNSLKSYEAAKATMQARKLSVEYARERYEVGLMNIFDFNQINTLYTTAVSDLLKTKYDLVLKTKILEYYFGIPLF